MSRQYCKYHPLEPALWYNPRTHTAYCERCVDSSETLGGLGKAVCYVSGDELQYLGSANTAKPFWDRLGEFFRYPFTIDSLAVIGIFMVATWMVVGLLEAGALPFMAISGLLLVACMTRYGFLIIEHSAEGRFDPPTLQETFGSSGLDVLYQQVAVQVIFIAFSLVVGYLQSDLLDALVNILVLFVWPASMMLLATEKSISVAVNPSAIWHLISSIGWSYILLYGFLFLLLGAQAAVFDIFAAEIPPEYFLPVFVAITLYFVMVSFHLMGYVIFQYQADIGFVAEDQLAKQKRRAAVEPVDAKAEILVKDGQYQKAVETLSKYLREHNNSIRHHDKLSRLLIALGEKEEALAHGQRYMELLNELGDDSRLYFLYGDYERLDPAFLPDHPEVCLSLAEQLFNRGKFKQVCHLLVNLHKRAPHFEQIPEAYLLTAKALLDGFDSKQKASQYLKFVRAKYPNFKELGEVERLLAQCGG